MVLTFHHWRVSVDRSSCPGDSNEETCNGNAISGLHPLVLCLIYRYRKDGNDHLVKMFQARGVFIYGKKELIKFAERPEFDRGFPPYANQHLEADNDRDFGKTSDQAFARFHQMVAHLRPVFRQ